MSRSLTPIRIFCLTMLCVQAFAALGASGAGERAMIDRDVLEAVRGRSARVLVEVRVPEGMRPEGELTIADKQVQRDAIATVQDSVLSGLAGSHFALVRRYDTVPLLLLEVQDDAVRALEQMTNAVVRVRLDNPKAPAAPSAAR